MPLNTRQLFHEGNERRPTKEKADITQVSLPELQRDRVRAYLLVVIGQLKTVDESADDLELQTINDLKFCLGKHLIAKGIVDVPSAMTDVEQEVLTLAEEHLRMHTEAIREQFIRRLSVTQEQAAEPHVLQQAVHAAIKDYMQKYYHGVAYTLQLHLLHKAKTFEEAQYTVQLTADDESLSFVTYPAGATVVLQDKQDMQTYLDGLLSHDMQDEVPTERAAHAFEVLMVKHLLQHGTLTPADALLHQTTAAQECHLPVEELDHELEVILTGLIMGERIAVQES